jgi:ABC-2 type transport system permease protein
MKEALIAFLGEMRKGLLISWTYRANMVVTLLTVGFVFVGIVFLMGGGQLEPTKLQPMIVGFMVWFFAAGAISDLAWGIRGETTAGTLEQMAMSPAPIGAVLLGRAFANLLWSMVQVFIQGAALMLLLGIRLPMRWQALVVLGITLVGIYGFGFIVAGMTLVFKQIESFANLMQNMLIFMNGTLLPVAAMPAWLAAIAQTMPTTQGILVLRRVLLDGSSLAETWRDGSLVRLTLHSTLYFAVGWAVFAYCERLAKTRGSLGQY